MGNHAIISQRVYSLVPDKALLLANASFVRRIALSYAWTRVRVGILVAVTPDYMDLPTNTLFGNNALWLGISSSAGGSVADYNTARFIGQSFFGRAGDTPVGLAYNAGTSGYPYYTPSSTGASFTKQGNTIQTVTGAGTPIIVPAYTGTTLWMGKMRRVPFYVDITRPYSGTGLTTIVAYGFTTATNALYDYRPDNFLAGLETYGTPTLNGQAMSAMQTTTTLSIGEEWGILDQFDLFWGNATFPLEVSAVGAMVWNTNATQYPGQYGGAVELFDAYGTTTSPLTTEIAGVTSAGTGYSAGWASTPGTFIGYSTPRSVVGFAGTSTGQPWDDFQFYGTGTIFSPILIDAGTSWASAGTII